MLFLFRGHNGLLVRAIVGAVLLVWGGIGSLSAQRARRQGHIGNGGPMS